MKIRMRDGSGSAELRYLSEETDRHGNVRLYVRRHGKRIRLREQPGTDAFLAEYRGAIGGTGQPKSKIQAITPGSFRSLLVLYYASPEFRGLGASTKKARKGILDGIAREEGAKPYRAMEARHVRRLRDAKADLPEAANGRVKALRQLFAWAKEAEHHDRNPAKEVPYIRTGSEGHHTWTVEEVRQYEARWPVGTKERLALALLLYTGVRRSDVVRLGPQMEQNGSLHFTETKGRDRKAKRRVLPILPDLRAIIDKTPSGHLAYLVTTFGKPFTGNGFGNWFRERCDLADLPDCSAHGLRKAGATIAANRGASGHQLMAIYGWDSPKQAALYTKDADRIRLAAEAMHLIVPEQKDKLAK